MVKSKMKPEMFALDARSADIPPEAIRATPLLRLAGSVQNFSSMRAERLHFGEAGNRTVHLGQAVPGAKENGRVADRSPGRSRGAGHRSFLRIATHLSDGTPQDYAFSRQLCGGRSAQSRGSRRVRRWRATSLPANHSSCLDRIDFNFCDLRSAARWRGFASGIAAPFRLACRWPKALELRVWGP